MQREEIVLEPAQEANLKHFRASYHGRPERVRYSWLQYVEPLRERALGIAGTLLN